MSFYENAFAARVGIDVEHVDNSLRSDNEKTRHLVDAENTV